MLYALINGQRQTARPGCIGICPGCGSQVVAKCGEINIWHWSHTSLSDCDPWYESESEWHLEWKQLAPKERCEVVIGRHRADVVSPKGIVIELQHSALSPAEVRERETYYEEHKQGIIWIVDAQEFEANLTFKNKGDYHSFRWKWPRKWMFAIEAPLLWDLGFDELFMVRKIYERGNCRGWGKFIERDQVTRFFEDEKTCLL